MMLHTAPNRRRIPLLALLGLFACSSASSADSIAPLARDTGPIVALVAAHDAAWNAHDAAALAALFAPEASLVTPRGTRAEGSTAIERIFAQPGPTHQTESRSKLEAVQWLDDDFAVVDVHQTLSGPGVEILGASEAKLVAVVGRFDGDWKLLAARPFAAPTR